MNEIDEITELIIQRLSEKAFPPKVKDFAKELEINLGDLNKRLAILQNHNVAEFHHTPMKNTVKKLDKFSEVIQSGSLKNYLDAKSNIVNNQINLEPNNQITLEKIEKDMLKYVVNSNDKVKSTKTFADAKGFSVSTINDVAKSLKEKYLITTAIEAGTDPKTNRGYTSFRCESTPLGVEFLAEDTNHLPQKIPATQPKQKPEKNKPQSKEKSAIVERLLKIAPLGIWITGIISVLLIIYFNGCR